MEINGINAEALYRQAIDCVLRQGELVDGQSSSYSIGRHRKTREVRNLLLNIDNPYDRIIQSTQRKVNLRFPFGWFIWTLFRRNDLGFMNYYNPHAASFSSDGKTLPGAYGPRIMPALEKVTTLLQEDPQSRRAVVHVHENSDLYASTKDIPCPTTLQFLIRNGKLEMMTTMRSQSVAMVLPYDLMLMTLIHEYVGVKMDRPLGRYSHFCVSAHIYEDEVALSTKIIGETISLPELMPRMQKADFSPETLQQVAIVEECNRLGNSKNKETISLSSPFWDYVGKVLEW